MQVAVPEYKLVSKVYLNPKITALVVVDMQYDFVHPKGKLFVHEAPQTIPVIRRLIQKARQAKIPVFFTQDWHRPDDAEFSIWPPHAVEGTEGVKVISELKPSAKDFYIHKRTYDAFFATDFDLLLRQMKIKNLIITGTVANICVLHTAGSARLYGYEIIIPRDAISSLTPFDQEAALRQISFVYQGRITKGEGIIFSKK
ncbi:MAG: cysteine hydrolase family protein [Thermodesulfobacteriota bacterium]